MLNDRNLATNRHSKLVSALRSTLRKMGRSVLVQTIGLLKSFRRQFNQPFEKSYNCSAASNFWATPFRIGLTGVLAVFLILTTGCLSFVASSYAASGPAPDEQNAVADEEEKDAERAQSPKQEDRSRRYHWLFKERTSEKPTKEIESSGVLDKLDREIRQARKLYLSGDTDNAILKYRSVIDYFESILRDIPHSNPLLGEIEDRFGIFDELAAKILGPVHSDIPEESVNGVFHLMEKRRICRRILTLKKAGKPEFYDVSGHYIQEESELLSRLWNLSAEAPTPKVKEDEELLKTKLIEVRKAIQKNSERCAIVRSGMPVSLPDLRRDFLAADELLLDFNLLPDRLVVGFIAPDKAAYHQIATSRAEIDKGVFHLQDRLREFFSEGQSTFMGHAWKEPCRRLFRGLLGRLPPLPKDKKTVFIIPDQSLWYLPFSVLLDSEDRPFGQDRIVSIVPSGDILKLLRIPRKTAPQSDFSGNLILFESIPLIPDQHTKEKPAGDTPQKKHAQKASSEETLERLILSNPVYPKPSDAAIRAQKMFTKFDVCVGPSATVDRFLDFTDRKNDVTVLATPLSVWDIVYGDRQPTLLFSPEKRGQRRFEAIRFFSAPVGTRLAIMPVAWFNVFDREAPSGDGPLLLSIAMFYAGFKMTMVNYSDPSWGTDDPFVMDVLKKAAAKMPLRKILADYPRDMPAGLDTSFSGKPPSWAGWILIGDPGM